MRSAERQATRQFRFTPFCLNESVNSSGIPTELPTSTAAPLSDKFLIMHSKEVDPNLIAAPLMVRSRVVPRRSDIKALPLPPIETKGTVLYYLREL